MNARSVQWKQKVSVGYDNKRIKSGGEGLVGFQLTEGYNH